MTRIALYLVCVTGLTVIGAKMIHWSTNSAQAQFRLLAWDRAEEEWCRDSAAHRPVVPPKITKPAEERKEKSRIVRALLGVIDEFDPDNEDGREDDRDRDRRDRDAFDGDYNSSETRGLLRRVLREADPELARSLGKNSLRLIAEANCKPRLPIYLHCDHEDDEFEDKHINGVHVIEWKERTGEDRADVDRNCPHQVRPLRWGTVENPIPPKNDARPEVERRRRERERGQDGGAPAGENPL